MYHHHKITIMKKKDFIWSLLTIVMIAMLSLGLSSCGEDDDDAGGGSMPKSAGVLDKDSNKRVKSIGNYSFYYNDNGQIDYITEGNTRYDFSYCTVNSNRYNYSYESLSTETRSTTTKDTNSRRRHLLLFFSTHE